MDSAKLNDWLQVVGIIGLVGSLISVGLQTKISLKRTALSSGTSARSAELRYMLRSRRVIHSFGWLLLAADSTDSSRPGLSV